MWPSLSLLGWLEVRTLPIFAAVAVFFAAFVFWRLLHQSARYNEFEVFDALIGSTLAGLIIGRLAHVGWHFSDFGFDWVAWLNVLAYPGISVFFSITSAAVIFWRYLVHLKITDLELLDYWVRGLCLSLIIYNIGLFFDGAGGGFLTTSWFALRFPETSFGVYPAQLLSAVFYTLIFFLLAYFEKNYRTYDWYRGTRSQAKTGFVFFAFWLLLALHELLALNYQPATYTLAGIAWDGVIYLATIITVAILFYFNANAATRKKVKKGKKK